MNEYVTSLMARSRPRTRPSPSFTRPSRRSPSRSRSCSTATRVQAREDPRAHHRAERVILSAFLGRRPGPRAREPRLPHRDEQRDRPLQGRLRFHPSVNLGILKFLAFEQVFKNSLTRCRWAAARRDRLRPKGKSDNEVMRFCQAFMSELFATSGPTRTCPPATSAWAAARSLPLRDVQEAAQRVHRRPHRKASTGAARSSARGHRLRLRVLRAGDARHPQGIAPGEDLPRLRQRQRLAVTRSRRSSTSAARWSPSPTRAIRLRRGRDRREKLKFAMD